jgi:hypothetical protein
MVKCSNQYLEFFEQNLFGLYPKACPFKIKKSMRFTNFFEQKSCKNRNFSPRGELWKFLIIPPPSGGHDCGPRSFASRSANACRLEFTLSASPLPLRFGAIFRLLQIGVKWFLAELFMKIIFKLLNPHSFSAVDRSLIKIEKNQYPLFCSWSFCTLSLLWYKLPNSIWALKISFNYRNIRENYRCWMALDSFNDS